MKKLHLYILNIFLLIVLCSKVLCQSTDLNKLSPLFLIDGLPIFSMDVLSTIDPQSITEINVSKDTLFDCRNKASYYGLITVKTKDSINTGLKYIIQKTDNWILSNPLAEYKLNGEIVNYNGELQQKLFLLIPSQIIKIKLIKPSRKRIKCDNGILIVKTK